MDQLTTIQIPAQRRPRKLALDIITQVQIPIPIRHNAEHPPCNTNISAQPRTRNK